MNKAQLIINTLIRVVERERCAKNIVEIHMRPRPELITILLPCLSYIWPDRIGKKQFKYFLAASQDWQ